MIKFAYEGVNNIIIDVVTAVNICLTIASFACAIFAYNQTKKQTEIMKEQLDESKKPNFPISQRLERIANEMLSINATLKEKLK
jgi:hypothetical protein